MIKSIVSASLFLSLVTASAQAASENSTPSLILPKDPAARAHILDGMVRDLERLKVTPVDGTPISDAEFVDTDPTDGLAKKWVTISTIFEAKTAGEAVSEIHFDSN